MALNPFFLQGSQGEQRLVQDLINEQLKIYGVEVTYIPRKFVRKQTVIKEVQSSLFDDNFLLEAYVNTYDGYSGQGDIMTKFGVSLKDELTVTVSKERFEDFIGPFLSAEEEYDLASRPREGDLVYFPLGQRLFEVKFVEHEQPFYQLGKTYVYELKCELFEYEDEVIDTDIEAIDTQVEDLGYISTLSLIGSGTTAGATAQINSGYVREITLTNDGYGYSAVPTVAISTAPNTVGSVNATAVAITTSRGGINSLDRILLTHAGIGYTEAPIITITGGGGSGAIATCHVETSPTKGVIDFVMTNNGVGYAATPSVTISGGVGAGGTVAVAEVQMSATQSILDIRARNSGFGYTSTPTITISNPSIISGVGEFAFNEQVRGVDSGVYATVKEWDTDTKVLKVSNVGIGSTARAFIPGEIIEATESRHFITAQYQTAAVGVLTTTVSLGSTAGVSVGQYINEAFVGIGSLRRQVMGVGSTVTAVYIGYITINPPSINDVACTSCQLGFGHSVFSNYSLKTYDERDTYSAYDSNDEIEDLADDLLDFTQSNPFGNV
tara:strand:- start:1203 stop:2861 length:1659 start_codon:yes stop_codon:yes gene_type:complete